MGGGGGGVNSMLALAVVLAVSKLFLTWCLVHHLVLSSPWLMPKCLHQIVPDFPCFAFLPFSLSFGPFVL